MWIYFLTMKRKSQSDSALLSFVNKRTCAYFRKKTDVHLLRPLYQVCVRCALVWTWDGWVSQNAIRLSSSTNGTKSILQSQELRTDVHKSVLEKPVPLLKGTSAAFRRCPGTSPTTRTPAKFCVDQGLSREPFASQPGYFVLLLSDSGET